MIVEKISGFRAKAPIRIYDAKDRLFYCKENSISSDKSVHFNLPAGEYRSERIPKRLRGPIRYILPKLPKPEYKRPLPELKIILENNPRKCSVYFATGIIKLDPKFADQPLPNITHILFHELGHFLYISEWKCDLFSCHNMLKLGFNPSQCLKVMLHNLSSDKAQTVERASKNLNYLKSVRWLKN